MAGKRATKRGGDKAPSQLSALEQELSGHLTATIGLIDQMTGNVRGRDCASALEQYEVAQGRFRRIARTLTQASSIHEQLRRAGLKGGAPAAPSCPVDRAECGYSIDGGA